MSWRGCSGLASRSNDERRRDHAGAECPRSVDSPIPERSYPARKPGPRSGEPRQRSPVATPVPAHEDSLLDEGGRLAHAVPAGQFGVWKADLRRGREVPEEAAWLPLWVGEYELAQNEQPELAIWHFRQARRLSGFPSTRSVRGHEAAGEEGRPAECAGAAAYDTALALYYAGAYQDAAAAFRGLVGAKALVVGYDGRRCLLW